MKRDYTLFLRDVIKSIDLIQEYIHGASENKFKSTPTIQDLVVYRLMIIGEAVKNIPDPIRKQNPEVPWKTIAGLRDVLIHQYFDTDYHEIWVLLKDHLPQLKKQIEKMIDS